MAHLSEEGIILTGVGLGDRGEELTYLLVDSSLTDLWGGGVDVTLALEPLGEDGLVEALLLQYEVEIAEEVIGAVYLATSLHPVHILVDREADI